MYRAQILCDVVLVPLEREEEATRDIEEGNVMIAGDDDVRRWQPFQIRSCALELTPQCALRQVAADRDERRLQIVEVFEQGLFEFSLYSSEVQIGNVGDDSHWGRRARGEEDNRAKRQDGKRGRIAAGDTLAAARSRIQASSLLGALHPDGRLAVGNVHD